MAKLPTIRILQCMALHHQWSIKQLDISNAFLNGKLEEEVYMLHSPGFIQSPDQVCKLNKALYGLKQAPWAWYSTFASFLLSQGFNNSQSDTSLFVHFSAGLMLLVVYVDDVLVIGSDPSLVSNLIT